MSEEIASDEVRNDILAQFVNRKSIPVQTSTGLDLPEFPELNKLPRLEKISETLNIETKKAVIITGEQLHNWYLEATKELDPSNFNKKAQKMYDELTSEQKSIDEYIANKVNNLINGISEKKKEPFGNLIERCLVQREKVNENNAISDADRKKLIEKTGFTKRKLVDLFKKG